METLRKERTKLDEIISERTVDFFEKHVGFVAKEDSERKRASETPTKKERSAGAIK